MLRATCCALLLSATLVPCDGGGGGDPDAMPPDAPSGPDAGPDAVPEPDGPSEPGAGLVLDLPVLDFMLTEIGVPAIRVLTVHNVTASAIANVVPAVTGDGFAIAATTCGALLDADASCTIDVGFAPAALGAASGTLEVTGGGHLSSAAVLGVGARRITVARSGAGSGTITSSPAGIACGDTCSALFAGAASLTVAPAAGSELAAWSSGPCAGTATTPCLVPAGTGAITAAATIAIDSAITLTIVVTGDAVAGGNDLVYDRGDGNGDVACATGCSVDVPAGTLVRIRTSTVSTFGGWTGGCSGAAADCALTVSADTTVTARFDRDDAESWTAFPSFAVTSVGFAPDGDVFVAGGKRIARYAAGGASQRWSVTMPAPAVAPHVLGLEADSTGAVFVLVGGGDGASTATLSKLDSAGAVVWTRTLTGVRGATSLAYPNQLAVTPTDDIVVLLNTTTVWLAAYDGAGTATSPPLWTKTSGRGRALDVDETGTVYVGVANPPFEDCLVLRFSAAGEPLADYGALPGSYDASLAVAAGHLAAGTSGFGHVTISRDLATLLHEDDLSPGALPQGVAIDGAGFAVALRAGIDGWVTGLVLRRFLPAGTWSIDKPPVSGAEETGVIPAGLAARGDDIAVIGAWQGYQGYREFVRVYGPPAL
jgi:hypothetical protein